MGLIYANMLPILEEHARRPLGSILFLGRPDIFFTVEAFRRWALARGIEPQAVHGPAEAQRPGYPSAQAVLGSLGVDFDVLDASGFEGANILFDLNAAATPEALQGRWDVIVDHGTMEHVFHLPNMLANLHRMLKRDGRVVHSSPGNNFFDHGFYQFSPTFFADYYGVNGWRIERHLVVRFERDHEQENAVFQDYRPADFEASSYGGLGEGLHANLFIASKTPEATFDRIPTQGYYRQRW
ncbi:MAG: methyltransferase domain-containing protein [Caulobacteraceae bacterium]